MSEPKCKNCHKEQYRHYDLGYCTPGTSATVFEPEPSPTKAALASKPPMTPEEALQEARKRWGKRAFIEVQCVGESEMKYGVGHLDKDWCCGYASFEAAFRAADGGGERK